jgi:hypothetical protein
MPCPCTLTYTCVRHLDLARREASAKAELERIEHARHEMLRPPPVIIERPVYVDRPVYVERRVYTAPAADPVDVAFGVAGGLALFGIGSALVDAFSGDDKPSKKKTRR